MRAIIKGNRFEAARAAAERGIPAVFVREHGTETVLNIGAQFADKIVAWFCEPGTTPFPIGTCLFYSSPRREDF